MGWRVNPVAGVKGGRGGEPLFIMLVVGRVGVGLFGYWPKDCESAC